MKDYVIRKAKDNLEYTLLLLCLSCENILTYLSQIEKEKLLKDKTGTIIVDQLLVSGNGCNRYLKCSFDKGKLLLSSCVIYNPDETIRKLSHSILKSKLKYIQNSILTSRQIENIKAGNIF